MRVKLSKLLSAVLAICIVFVGFTLSTVLLQTVLSLINLQTLLYTLMLKMQILIQKLHSLLTVQTRLFISISRQQQLMALHSSSQLIGSMLRAQMLAQVLMVVIHFLRALRSILQLTTGQTATSLLKMKLLTQLQLTTMMKMKYSDLEKLLMLSQERLQVEQQNSVLELETQISVLWVVTKLANLSLQLRTLQLKMLQAQKHIASKEEITMKKYTKPSVEVVELSVKESLSSLPFTFKGVNVNKANNRVSSAATIYRVRSVNQG